MKKLLIALSVMLAVPCHAAETLADWAQTFQTPETQQKMLNLIFPGLVGSITDAKKDAGGMYLFPKGGFWFRIGADKVVILAKDAALPPVALVVSCMQYQDAAKEPINATSYLFRDTSQKPIALSAGYSAHERVQSVNLPLLGMDFILLSSYTKISKNQPPAWTATLFAVPKSSIGNKLKPAWTSPVSLKNFKYGFNALGGATEALVIRTIPREDEDVNYLAYRWNGEKFELDEFAMDTRIMSLPESVWQYGSR